MPVQTRLSRCEYPPAPQEGSNFQRSIAQKATSCLKSAGTEEQASQDQVDRVWTVPIMYHISCVGITDKKNSVNVCVLLLWVTVTGSAVTVLIFHFGSVSVRFSTPKSRFQLFRFWFSNKRRYKKAAKYGRNRRVNNFATTVERNPIDPHRNWNMSKII